MNTSRIAASLLLAFAGATAYAASTDVSYRSPERQRL
jgi:hypothetical protein